MRYVAREVMTLRLDERARKRLAVAAARRRLTPSASIRLAIDAWLEDEESAASLRPYDLVKNLVGCVAGNDPLRSSRAPRPVSRARTARRGRAR